MHDGEVSVDISLPRIAKRVDAVINDEASKACVQDQETPHLDHPGQLLWDALGLVDMTAQPNQEAWQRRSRRRHCRSSFPVSSCLPASRRLHTPTVLHMNLLIEMRCAASCLRLERLPAPHFPLVWSPMRPECGPEGSPWTRPLVRTTLS